MNINLKSVTRRIDAKLGAPVMVMATRWAGKHGVDTEEFYYMTTLKCLEKGSNVLVTPVYDKATDGEKLAMDCAGRAFLMMKEGLSPELVARYADYKAMVIPHVEADSWEEYKLGEMGML